MGKASVLIVLSDSIIQGRLSLFQFKFQNLHKIFYALHLNDTMSTSLLTTHKKNAHLTKEERVMIATLKSQGLSNRAIGRQLGVNHQTINNELNRGTVRQLRRQKFNGKTYDYPYHIYSYEAGQNIYLKCHQRSGRPRLYYRSKRF